MVAATSNPSLAVAWCSMVFRGPLLAAVAVFALHGVWNVLARAWPYSDRAFWLTMSMVIHETLYYGLNGFFLACDHYGWLQTHKLPRTPRMRASRALLVQTLKESLVGHWLVQPLSLYVIYTYAASFPSRLAPLPPFLTVWAHLIGAHLFNEVFFYLAHRALHESKFLYAKIHKQHHSYVGSVGFAAEYAHPVEQVLANQFPSAGYCVIFSVHPLLWCVWLTWRLIETYEAHSGFCFSDTLLGRMGLLHGERAVFHDFHHTANTGNYGCYPLDAVLGSSANFDAGGGFKGYRAQ